jgi:hypothetical protein
MVRADGDRRLVLTAATAGRIDIAVVATPGRLLLHVGLPSPAIP